MRYRLLLKLLGLLILVMGATMVWPLAWSLYFWDGQVDAFLISIGACLAGGGALFLTNRGVQGEIYRREGLAVVGLGWLLAAAFGALPFVLSGALPSYVDAYFETMSGLTTTGASVFQNQTFLTCPPSVLFWRSLTHWLGGVGIVVLFVAVFPLLGVGGKQLFRSEVPGPTPEGLRPRIAQAASALWKIYLALSALQTLLLMVGGMNLFEALCHTFGTMATGGFSTRASSVAAFDSVYIEMVIIVFMLLAGTNFALFYRVLAREKKVLRGDTEWRVYLGLLVIATAAITALLLYHGTYPDLSSALRYGSFQVVSITTTTGFITADYELWPTATKVILLALMFVGGSAGSTGGGLKVVRWIVLVKVGWFAIRKTFLPHMVQRLKLGGTVIDEGVRDTTLAFYFLWTLVFIVATILVSLFPSPQTGSYDVLTALTSVAATLNNIGPGLAGVGAVENYAFWAAPVKVILSLCMIMGRLELFAILALLTPSFWRQL